MSGIYGIINLKNNPVDPSQMNKMEELLIHRGVDGKAQWIDGHVGLGHLKLEITPESEYEKLPLEYKQWVITADARIDNRDELDVPLNVLEEARPFTPDTTYIVKAYEKWGKDCVKHLIGDFAFTIWDKVEKTLFCARDHIGIKPFFYLKTEDKFIFASELKTIVELRELPVELNESKFGDWMYRIQDLHNPTDTLFMNVKRLMPAHFGLVTLNTLQVEQYWVLKRNQAIELSNDNAYAEKFKELIVQSVECRMRTRYNIGATLSGGLDSSSIACIAAKKLSKEEKLLYTASSTLTNNWKGIEEDEKQFINEVLKQEKNIESTFVTILENNFFKSLNDNLCKTFFPVNPFYDMDNALVNDLKKQNNVRLILSGFMGDMAVSQKANNLIPQLINEGKILKAVNLIKKRLKVGSSYLNLIKEITTPIIPQFLIYIYRLTKKNNSNTQSDSRFNESFIRKHNLDAIYKKKLAKEGSTLSIHANIKLAIDCCVSNFEEMNILHAHFAVEENFPFADIRLIDFLMKMPIEYFQMNGWKRGLIRHSMNKILPEKIQKRSDKSAYMPNFNRNLLNNKTILYKELVNTNVAENYLNLKTVGRTLENGYIFSSWASQDFSGELALLGFQFINIQFINLFKKYHNE